MAQKYFINLRIILLTNNYFFRMGNPQTNKYQFKLSHDVKDIDQIEHAIEEIRKLWDVSDKSLFQLNLVLEELISNTMFYGFDGNKNGIIEVDLSFDGQHIHVSIHDDALPFDPTAAVHDSTETELDERKIGGLGIMLTQQISEDMQYEYHENKNKLRFKINTQPNVEHK
jgi:anti-sigma regulatory factor (Ser/Thr protein kinase)